MSQPGQAPVRYRTIYSEQVRRALVDLVNRASTRELRQQVLAAAREIDARLRIYPQFGEPLRDLETEGETLWIGTIPPLTVQYIVDEVHRIVFLVIPYDPLPKSGL